MFKTQFSASNVGELVLRFRSTNRFTTEAIH